MAHGRFQTADGAPLGTNEFYISSSGAYNQVARVAYGDGKFLVTWLDVRSDPRGAVAWVYGRLLSYGAGGVATFAGPDFLIGAAPGGVEPRACGRGGLLLHQQAVPRRLPPGRWRRGPSNDIRGQLVSTTGQLVGAPINISFDNHFQGEVGVGYSPASDKFLVAYRHFYEPAGPATIQSRTVSAVDGALGAASRHDGLEQHQRARGLLQLEDQPVSAQLVAGPARYRRYLLRPAGEPGRRRRPPRRCR